MVQRERPRTKTAAASAVRTTLSPSGRHVIAVESCCSAGISSSRAVAPRSTPTARGLRTDDRHLSRRISKPRSAREPIGSTCCSIKSVGEAERDGAARRGSSRCAAPPGGCCSNSKASARSLPRPLSVGGAIPTLRHRRQPSLYAGWRCPGKRFRLIAAESVPSRNRRSRAIPTSSSPGYGCAISAMGAGSVVQGTGQTQSSADRRRHRRRAEPAARGAVRCHRRHRH